MSNTKFWNFKAIDDKTGELYLYSQISSSSWWGDEVTPKKFKDDLDSLGDIETLNVFINSPGGDVFAGVTIGNMLKRSKAKVNVYVDGYAASIASVIAMAGDEINMYSGSMLMVHNPWTFVAGNSEELRKMAEDLDNIKGSLIECYLERATDELSEEKLIELLNEETWMGGKEAEKYFSNIKIINESKNMVASVKDCSILSQYRNTPEFILNNAITDNSQTHQDKIVTDLQNKIEMLTSDNEKLNGSYNDLVSTNEGLTKKNEDLTIELNEAKEKIVALSEIEKEYNDAKYEAKLTDVMDSYKAKFNKVNALDKFESDEVQNLIKDSIEDVSKSVALNEMIIDLMPDEDTKSIKEIHTKKVSNLIPKDQSFESRYCN